MDARALARLVENVEAAAYADLLRAAPAEWRCEAEDTPAGWLLRAPALDALLFNRIVAAGVNAPATREAVDAIVDRLRSAGVKNYGLQLSPAAEPREIDEWLSASGLVPRDRWTKVFRGAEPAPRMVTEYSITQATPGDRDGFAAVAAAGFGMPPPWCAWLGGTIGRPGWRHYLAWQARQPVACAAIYVHGDAGWLGVATTISSARGRGAQGALMARRIEDGLSLGCKWFVTETGEDTPAKPNPSFRNMIRAGFTVAYHRQNFMPPKG